MADETSVLVVIETSASAVREASLELLTAAKTIAGTGRIDAVVIGHHVDDVAQQVAKLGPEMVLVVDDPALERYRTQYYVAAIETAIERTDPDLVLLIGTTSGRDLGPYMAALRGNEALVDCINIQFQGGSLSGTRPVFQGKMLSDITIDSGKPAFAVIRTGVFEMPTAGDSASIEQLSAELPETAAVDLVGLSQVKAGGAALEDADIVVCGGRGVGSAENFDMLIELADRLDGAVGATRAVTDLGWRPHQTQIGQTGAKVRPKLYIGIGVSGAVQHMVGMQNSETVIAINRDPDAPLFRLAELGIVGDLHAIVPELIKALDGSK